MKTPADLSQGNLAIRSPVHTPDNSRVGTLISLFSR
ncbi:hypothetical protein MXB_3673 [Myxobolus squamalis]|nr:hypothetical protein MXB_3673 [Myxobolus squamalis]